MPEYAIEKKLESRKRRDSTYEERRSRALRDGKPVLFLTCPLCGRNRPLKTHLGGKSVFKVKPDYAIVQVRKTVGGRGSGGFFLDDRESIKIGNLRARFPDVYRNLREEIGKLYRLFYG